MNYILNGILVILMITASYTQKINQKIHDIEGLYGECGKSTLSCGQYLLKSDGTFEHYYTFLKSVNPKIVGKWYNLNDSVIILRSDYQIVKNPFSNIEDKIPGTDTTTIVFVNKIDEVLPAFAKIISSDTVEITYKDFSPMYKNKGHKFINKSPIKKIIIKPMDDEEFEYVPEDRNSNYIKIVLRDKPNSKAVINDTLLIQGNKLYLWNTEKRSFYVHDPLIKTDTSNKIKHTE